MYSTVQQSAEYVPMTSPVLPMNVTGELDLTQCLNGPLENATADSRGLVYTPDCNLFYSNATQVAVGTPMGMMMGSGMDMSPAMGPSMSPSMSSSMSQPAAGGR